MTLRRTLQRSLSTTTRSLSQFGSSGGAAPSPLLLDTYSGAAAAYSLRRLNTAYTGPVVQVRRSGDSAEDTFSADEVGDGTLAAWVTAGGGTEDGFVKTWYDQSGNGNDASQATAASQPQIVASGAVVLENGEASIAHLSTTTRLDVSISYNSDNHTVFMLADITSTANAAYRVLTIKSEQAVFRKYGPQDAQIYGAGFDVTTVNNGWPSSEQLLFSIIFAHQDGDLFAYRNGSSIYSSTTKAGLTSASVSGYSIGGVPTEGFVGNVQEIVVYTSNQSSNRTGIESNLASHYGITLS